MKRGNSKNVKSWAIRKFNKQIFSSLVVTPTFAQTLTNKVRKKDTTFVFKEWLGIGTRTVDPVFTSEGWMKKCRNAEIKSRNRKIKSLKIKEMQCLKRVI